MSAKAIYRTVWRWHFYAGLLVKPLILVLALSGAAYLFKPQIERWEERSFQQQPVAGTVLASAQVAAAQAALPGAKFIFYRLPERPGDAAMVHLALPGHAGMRDVFVSPQGRVLGSLDPDARIIAWDRKVHGQLLLGRPGSWLVELAASWAIVMILSGLYLWWPRGTGLAGVVWPRWTAHGRPFWRDLHAVAGFWVSSLALVLLITGLPWADVWGSAFKAVRAEMGWVKGRQDWTVGGRPAGGAGNLHAEHDHAAMMQAMPGMAHDTPARFDPVRFDAMVDHAHAEQLAFPAVVVPPGAPAGEGGAGKPATGWVVKSEAQDRPLRLTLRYDAGNGALVAREDFASRHPIDKVVAVGVAWHEGQLFGWVNQLIGLLTALMLVTLVVSGFVMWRRRKPESGLGAPPALTGPVWPRGWGFRVLALFLLVWLPLFTLSLVTVALVERLVLPRLPGLSRWLGIPARVPG
ncbi:PepSY domain-containing protein [Novosphingobium sp.]|uniref:PepSY-associated TM helix domain-containing protein n=1 Tax=Novosphingobium sp. TaxID=1874826 RepID=UPI0025D01A07|nr:PepSY domain-containing protein [Novosphingobium sp.]